ncbi:fatty-acid-binding protein 1 [Vigna unguiculata]|uniref:Chalcone isomerase n=1 Tax=Vigna unguiculata TaxID=3917 RepID=A0A4D6M8K8_VIGUN|nr:fatty-acid-binding protein 1 [Vigna unguiculata]QCD97625.1 Chalcone isomerase [Vigna unguiculata]
MASMRFPFSFPRPQPPQFPRPFTAFAAVAAVAGASAAVVAVSSSDRPFLRNALNSVFSSGHSLPLWGSISLADSGVSVLEAKTGTSFPSVLASSQKLCGIGLRKKSVLGLKNIDVYAFGVYADDDDIKAHLSDKYGKFSASELQGNKEFIDDLMDNDISMTVRLQIVYGRLSIRSVRSAFEESVGNRLQKFGGSDNKELLQRFTSQFRDEIKLPRGSVIHLSREKGHVLRTSIDGQEVGSIKSKLLCKSIIDLYCGEEAFDKQAKEEIEHNVASYL